MNTPKPLLTTSCTLATCVVLSLPQVLMAEPQVRGQSPIARIICKDVLRDDAVKLHRHLKRYQRDSVLLSGYFRTNSSVIHRDFSCNNLALLPFAESIGAESVAQYLWQKERGKYRVTVEDVSVAQH